MMWLTWRQFRVQAIVAAAGLVLVAIVLAVSGVELADKFHASTAGCGAHGDCGQLATNFIQSLRGSGYQAVALATVVLIYAVPGLMGVFWGAPLITREIETGTVGLAWTQSVTRTRWLAVKVGSVGLAAMAIAGLLSLLASWWINPVYEASAKASSATNVVYRLWPIVFGVNGIAPIGYAAFGFALGLTLGVLIRRTLPAMAATLAAFAGIQVAWPQLVRPHLIKPLRSSAPIHTSDITGLMLGPHREMIVTAGVSKPGAWVVSNQTVDAAGHPFTGPSTHACQTGPIQACNASIGRLHLRQLLTYQPASRYWTFQWYETAIFVALALLLVAYCYWRVSRRRLT
jgi:ABC-type transport system involved in multi-copper enzyme maturation permease subunit